MTRVTVDYDALRVRRGVPLGLALRIGPVSDPAAHLPLLTALARELITEAHAQGVVVERRRPRPGLVEIDPKKCLAPARLPKVPGTCSEDASPKLPDAESEPSTAGIPDR